MSPIDAELLRRFQADHDEFAFAEVMRSYLPLVQAACRRVLSDPSRIDDAVQETFLRLALQPGAVTTALGGWLHVTATRVSISILRSDAARHQRERIGADLGAHGWERPGEDLFAIVRTAVLELSDEDREVIVAHHLEGTSLAVIAGRRGIPVSSVQRHLERARLALRERLRRQGIETPVGCSILLLILGGGRLLPAPPAVPVQGDALPVRAPAGSTPRPAASPSRRRWVRGGSVAAALAIGLGCLWSAMAESGTGPGWSQADPGTAGTLSTAGRTDPAWSRPRAPAVGAVTDQAFGGSMPRRSIRVSGGSGGGVGSRLGEDASLADARLASGIAASKDDGAGSRPPGVPTPAAERNMDGRAPVASTGDATAGGRQLTGAAPGRRRGADAASAAAAGSGSVRQDRSGGRDRVVPAPAAEASRHPDQGRGTLPGTGIGSGPQFLPVIPSLLR